MFRIGPWAPWREGDIPFYYEDVRVNNVPLKLDDGWGFSPPQTGADSKTGSVFQAPELNNVGNFVFKVVSWKRRCDARSAGEKGETYTVTMKAKAGSVLDSYATRLRDIAEQLQECVKLENQDANLSKIESTASHRFVERLNNLISMSSKDLGMTLSTLAKPVYGPKELQKELFKLSNAYEERIKQLKSKKRPLFSPKTR